MAKTHLVLGGSQGIGFAYAAHMAARGDNLALVARRPTQLATAKADLLSKGAASVETLIGDLLDPDFRARLKDFGGGYDSILVSGPSPPVGGLEITAEPNWSRLALQGCRASLVYPVEILEWALGAGLVAHGRLILVSSASAAAEISDTPFLLSRLFRALLHELLPAFESRFAALSRSLYVWRPTVILTPLSIAFAAQLAARAINEQEAYRILSDRLGITDLRDAREYVEFELGKME